MSTSGRSIAVAVIARPGAPIAACVEALGAAGVKRPHVVELGRPGAYAEARNAALSACEADVLALVEDDVLVDPGWLGALQRTWDADAADALGCTGGPLRPLFPSGRPAWLGDGLLSAFAVSDLGADGDTVDLATTTFHGGNVAFRADALRGVGGFWPVRGHADGRDWFSEEHHAQRELGRAGWTGRHVPEAAAARVIPVDVRRSDVLRRRARYGARSALIGAPRPRATSARRIAAGMAGAPLAAVQGNTAQAMERAARAMENAGALASRIAVADLQPVATETAFLDAVPGGNGDRGRQLTLWSARRSRPRPRGAILLYHRVAEPEHDPLGLAVAPGDFAEQLAALDEIGIATLEEVAAGEPGVAITFDDGYADNLHAALPLLRDAGAPATVFVSTGHVGDGRAFWWDALARLLARAGDEAGPLRLTIGGDRRAWRPTTDAARAATRRHLQQWLQPRSPEAIGAVLSAVGRWAGEPGDPLAPAAHGRPMTVPELRELAADEHITIGAHGRTHRRLAGAPAEALLDELAGSADDLERWAGTRPMAFAYAFGVPGRDVDAAAQQAARRCGYALGVVNRGGVVDGAQDPLALPRLAAPAVGGTVFAAWLRERLSQSTLAGSPAR